MDKYFAAPTTGRLLADGGGEVIEADGPRAGGDLCNGRLYQGTTSMLFHAINRNKKSVVLDLYGREIAETDLHVHQHGPPWP